MTTELVFPHQRLRWARHRAGYSSAADAAQYLGMNAVTYRAYESGQNGFGKLAVNFARKFGVTVEFLMEGGAVPEGEPPARVLTKEIGAVADETVEIAQLDLSFSMGPGSNIDDYIEQTPLTFGLSYVRSFTRATTDELRLAKGVGESMFPTLVSNDEVWIDTTQRVLNQQDRVWAISLYGAAAIKRLRMIGEGRVLVMSDNPAVENQIVDAADILIGGRVIRFARDI